MVCPEYVQLFAAQHAETAALLLIGDLTREGVKNFVEAEKALIDTMMKKSTKGGIKPKGRVKPRAKKAVRRPRPAVQTAVAD